MLVEKTLQLWSKKGIFRLDEDNLHYILDFHNATLRQIKIPKITEDVIKRNPRFLYKRRLYNVDQFLAIVINSRFKQMHGNKFHYNYLLQNDIINVFSLQINVTPNTYNNLKKLRSRIRIVKDSKVVRGMVVPFAAIGDGLQGSNRTLAPEEIAEYVELVNPDPIGADQPGQSVLSKLDPGDKYLAPMFDIYDKGFASIFPVKQNIVERFKAHITGDGLKWVSPDYDPLVKTPAPEVKNILVVFDEINEDLELIAGEIPISERLAREKIMVDRSIQLQGTVYIITPIGSRVENGDVIAYDVTGKPMLRYDMDKPGIVEDVVNRYPTGITVKISYEDELGAARVISRTGLKGVTFPRRTLGTVKINGKYYPVDAVVGPNSNKGKFNAIRLAWLAFKARVKGESLDLPINADINALTKDIHKVEWHSPDGLKHVYAGVMSIMPTTKVPPDPFKKTKVMTETLKFLKLYRQDKLINLLVQEGVDPNDRELVNEMVNILTERPESLPVITKHDLAKNIFSTELIPLLQVRATEKIKPRVLLNPFNEGFVLRFETFDAIMPSSRLINHFVDRVGEYYVYPDFYMYAIRMLFGIQRNHSEEQLKANYTKYLNAVAQLLLKKRGFITSITTPKLFGGSLMQLPSKYVPRNHIVVIHKLFKPKLRREAQDETLVDSDNMELYDISVRNPVLWNAQLKIKRVWTVEDFKKHLKINLNVPLGDVIVPELANGVVLRNPLDMMDDQSDADGDELGIAIPLYPETQTVLKKLFKKQFPISKYEREWIKKYTLGEMDNSSLTAVPFTLHEMDRATFNQIMIQAAISKNGIGQGTINLWKFTTLLELMLYKKRITRREIPVLLWMYGKVVHDHVVRGIKYSIGDNGSAYELFLPESVEDNRAHIVEYWKKLYVPDKYIRLFVAILKTSQAGVITAASRIVNGGNVRVMTGFLNKITKNPAFDFLLSYQLLNFQKEAR